MLTSSASLRLSGSWSNGLYRSIVVFDDYLLALNDHRIGLYPHAWINQATAGSDLELPQVPGATYDLTIALVGYRVWIGRGWKVSDHSAADPAGAERPELVRAEVAQGVELAVDVENADAGLTPKRHHDFTLAW